ncbi:MAG: VCBS repeat-containing protein, partial [Pseudomonadota bacterium]
FFYLIFIFFTKQINALEFEKVIYQLEHPSNGDFLALKKDNDNINRFIISGYNWKNRWLTSIAIDPMDNQINETQAITLNSSLQYFDKARLYGSSEETIVFLGKSGLSQLNLKTYEIEPLLNTSSLYKIAYHKRLSHLDFSMDINGDNLSDFLIPDFQQLHVYMQKNNGEFKYQSLPVLSTTEIRRSGVSYYPEKPYFYDVNSDNLIDVLFHVDGKVLAFLQNEALSFQSEPFMISTPIQLANNYEAEIKNGEGRNFDELTIEEFNRFEDLNADGIVDLVTVKTDWEGITNQDGYFKAFLGAMDSGKLIFQAQPIANIHVGGGQYGAEFKDINNDGLKDFYSPNIELGIGSIISALITGSTGMDINFFPMSNQHKYSEKADFSKEAKIRFSLKSGNISMPSVLVDDFTGDGISDLLIQSSTSKLKFYPGQKARLFAKRSESTIKIDLPKNGQNVDTMDFNHDGKKDLIITFSGDDKKEWQQQVHIYLTK